MSNSFLNELFNRRSNTLNQHPAARFEQLSNLLNTLPMPKKNFKTFHLAGSKGKGTTAHMLAKTLFYLDYQVLLFTSPHLITVNERFLYNLEPIEQQYFLQALHWLAEYESNTLIKFNFFDAMTAMAFYLATYLSIDFLILEAGIGGRLDATNICQPIATIITPIELEHTALLGNTLSAIAKEKAGIIKPQIPLFLAQQNDSSYQTIKNAAQESQSRLYYLPEYLTYNLNYINQQPNLSFTYNHVDYSAELKNPLPALAENALLAFTTLDQILNSPKNLYSNWKKALNSVFLPARYQQISNNIVIDGSHTPKSFDLVSKTFEQTNPEKELILIFGCAKDKDFFGMQQYFQRFSDIILVGVSSISHEMHNYAKTCNYTYYPSLPSILNILNLKKEQAMLITGSLYLAAEALTYYDITLYPKIRKNVINLKER